jgi:hypothetical protein
MSSDVRTDKVRLDVHNYGGLPLIQLPHYDSSFKEYGSIPVVVQGDLVLRHYGRAGWYFLRQYDNKTDTDPNSIVNTEQILCNRLGCSWQEGGDDELSKRLFPYRRSFSEKGRLDKQTPQIVRPRFRESDNGMAIARETTSKVIFYLKTPMWKSGFKPQLVKCVVDDPELAKYISDNISHRLLEDDRLLEEAIHLEAIGYFVGFPNEDKKSFPVLHTTAVGGSTNDIGFLISNRGLETVDKKRK